jgi:two-component system, cell cycle response regulator DivK
MIHPSKAKPSLSRPLILIVDDFDDALEIYWQYLTFRGYRVIAATGGDEAVAAARAYRPDLILMDLRMAGTNGTAAMCMLREDGRTFRNTPIVAFTAQALDEERIKALADGFDDFIAKPCLPDKLVLDIERLLSVKTVFERR